MAKFAETVLKWTEKATKNADLVFKASCQDLAVEMKRTINNGGKVPVITRNLSRSLLASTSSMPVIKKLAKGENFPENDGPIGAVIHALQPGQTLYIGYQAAYARRVNYGFVGTDSLGRKYNQTGRHFVAAAVAKWPEIIAKNAKEIGGV